MKYKDVNWLLWPEAPSEQVFNDWVKARKSKKHPALTITSMNKYSKHVARLVSDDVCSVEMAFGCAAEAGWRAIFYSYVVGAISREMDAYSGVQPEYIDHQKTSPNIARIEAPKTTREMTLQDESDDSWAH